MDNTFLALYISNFVESAFFKRLKSFLWRFASYMFVVALAWLTENIGMLELSPFATTVVALVLGEITKYFNKAADTNPTE